MTRPSTLLPHLKKGQGQEVTRVGLVCRNVATDPFVQAQVVAEQNKINKDTAIVRFYPLASIGLGIRF